MDLYTFIMEYKGGTYISQVEAHNLYEARKIWAGELNTSEIQYFGPKAKTQLIEQMNDPENEPVELEGLTNVWCDGATINGSLALINIVKI